MFVFSPHAQLRFKKRVNYLCGGDLDEVTPLLKPLPLPTEAPGIVYFYLGPAVFVCREDGPDEYYVLTVYRARHIIKKYKDKTLPGYIAVKNIKNNGFKVAMPQEQINA